MFVEMPWLQKLGTNEVSEWMKRRGITPRKPMKIIHMPGNMIMEAVRRGDGLTYTPRIFVDEEIRSGQLLEVSSENDVGGFYIVTRPGVLRQPVRAFVTWLKRQAGAKMTTRSCWRLCRLLAQSRSSGVLHSRSAHRRIADVRGCAPVHRNDGSHR